jgi:class 3 adenylate cyclase
MTCSRCGHRNPDGARFCNQCGLAFSAVAPAASGRGGAFASPAAFEGERKLLTVLFADVRGSTSLVAGKDPEEARRLLDPVLTRMIDAVRRHGGTVNQVMGDGVMALFGAPIAFEDHALRACRAALDIQGGTVSARGDASDALADIRIRVGMNSGEVVVRSITSDVQIDYTAVGEVTHLASRMEQLARPGAILLSGNTMRLVERVVETIPHGWVPVAGLPEPVEVHELTRLIGGEALLAKGADERSRFVGREEEIVAMQAALELAESGNGQMIVLVGEAGVGKTRLVKQMLRNAAPDRWLVLTVTCDGQSSSASQMPIANLLRQFFGVSSDWATDAVLDRVKEVLSDLDAGLASQLSAVAALLGVLPEDNALARQDPGQRRQAILESLQGVVQAQCRRKPLLVFVDDLHLIDEDSLWLLDALLESLPGARLMLLAASRPEGLSGWRHRLYMKRFAVGPLPARSAEELVDGLLGSDAGLDDVRADLLGRTEGNPLFIEECVAALAEDGSLVGAPGAFRRGQAARRPVGVPPTIRAIVAARVDRMDPRDATLLRVASVAGRGASLALLVGLSNASEPEVRRSLARLHESGLLRPDRSHGGDHLVFKHALIQEVVYAGLLRDRRRDLHARVFEFLEAGYGDRCDYHAEELAHHALGGALSLQAIRYLRRAGEGAARRSAHFEAIRFFSQALAELARFPESFDTHAIGLELRLALGPELRTVNGGWSPDVEACYQPALELCDRVEAASPRLLAQFGLWSCYSSRGDYVRAREAADNLFEVSRSASGMWQLEARHALWSTAIASGHPAQAKEHLEAADAMAPEHEAPWWKYGSHDPSTCRLQMTALAAWLRGDFDRARRLATVALQRAKQTGHSYTNVMAMYTAAVIHYHCGDHGAAKLRATNASRLGRLHGVKSWPEHASIVLARLAFLEGNAREGRALVDANLPGALEAGWPWTATISAGLAADLYLAEHRPEDGLALLASVPTSACEGLYAPELLRLRARLLLARSDGGSDEAEVTLRRALQLSQERGLKALELRTAMTLAYHLAPRDRRDAYAVLGVIEAFKGDVDVSDVRAGRALREWLR